MEAGSMPTPEEIAQANEVSGAAAGALGESVAAGDTKTQAREKAQAAARSAAANNGAPFTEEQCNQVVDMLIERMDALGVFNQPPPAAAPVAPGAPGSPAGQALTAEQQAAAAAAAAAATPAPEKLSWGERFAPRDYGGRK